MTPPTAPEHNGHTGQTPPVAWRRSRRSIAGGDCVEVAITVHQVLVKDSRDPSGLILAFGIADWQAFIHSLKRDDP